MIIQVTQDHIRKGQPGSSACPIAIAICEATKTVVSVLHYVVTLRHGHLAGRYELPAPCNAFILAFDAKKQVEPFEFELALDKRLPN